MHSWPFRLANSFTGGCAVLLFVVTIAASKAATPIPVVTTTSMVTDLVQQIGGDRVTVSGLMGPGVDPHLYKASTRDVTRLHSAKAVFYNGLMLEGRMSDLFERL